MSTRLVISALLIICFPQVSNAFTPAQKAACGSDYNKFCATVNPGGGRIVNCLKEHADQLSDSCKAVVADLETQLKAQRQACMPDYAKFCGAVTPGGGAVVKCLQEHLDQLNPQCRTAIATLAKRGG